MASKKFYGYYIKGNKLALIEKDVSTSGSDLNAEDYGKYKSPRTNVTDGLEIEYTYAPTYNLSPTAAYTLSSSDGSGLAGGTALNMFGWTSEDGYLALYQGPNTSVSLGTIDNFSSASWDSEMGTAGTDYVLIQGSNMWDGVHQIKTRGAGGLLVLNTRVIGPPMKSYNTFEGVTVSPDGSTIPVGSTYFQHPIDSGEQSYGFPALFADGEEGTILFQPYGEAITLATWFNIIKGTVSYESSTFKFDVSSYYALQDADGGQAWNEITTGNFDISNRGGGGGTSAHSDNLYVYKIIEDNCTVYLKNTFTHLQDESFELDLPIYLQKAMIYYLKAKNDEFKGDIEKFQYNMSQFKRLVEKHNSARTIGPSFVQGFWGMR